MEILRQDFLPEHLHSELRKNLIDGCVAVQADQSERETEFLLGLAQKNSFIKGVVGWVDLLHSRLEQRLEYYSDKPRLKGFRHIVQDEPDPKFMLNTNFQKGISMLSRYNLTYDILIYPKHFDSAIELVRKFPNQKFVLDHIGKPGIARGEVDNWKQSITQLGAFENVYCKISGMVTEANWSHWEFEDFRPYVETVIEVFGSQRLMYGSDWPVCLLSAKYDETKSVADYFLSELSDDELDQIMGLTATEFYNL